MSTGRFTRKMRDGDALEFATVPPIHVEVEVHMDTQEAFISGAWDVDARDGEEADGGFAARLRRMDWLRVWPTADDEPILLEFKRCGSKVECIITDPLCRRVHTSVAEDADDAP